MPEFVIYDSLTGYIKEKYYSVDPSIVEGKANLIQINRDLFNALTEYYIVDAGQVRAMTQAEKDAYDIFKQQEADTVKSARIALFDQEMFDSKPSDFPMAKIDSVIDGINNLAEAKVFLKRLARILFKWTSK